MLRCNYHKSWSPSLHHHFMYTPQHPWPASVAQKKRILTPFLLNNFPQIVPLCPALLGLHWEHRSLNLNVFDEPISEWVCFHAMCFTSFPLSCRGPCETQLMPAKLRRPSPFKSDPSGLRPLWFSTLFFFTLCNLLSIFFSHYCFYSPLILSSLDLLVAAGTLKVVLEMGKIIGNKENTLVEA